jgi:DNA mismatch repair protein MutL
MSDIIKLLPDVIANQIAAGEVIQRPASVVKELLENSIDAGANEIKLIIQDSGKTLIQVVDDGRGMSETDARMSLERHATSKIRSSNDLFNIKTLGFRGEALASIAAVSRMEIITKEEDRELATRIKVEGSQIKAQEYCAAPTGTNIAVRHLFYNIPARRKFLKSDTVELKHILDEFQRTAIPYPEIQFRMIHNEKEVYHLPKGNLRQRIISTLGKNYNERLVPLDEKTDVVKFAGFIGKPEFSRKTRGDQFFFINGRFFRSGYLHHAVMGAYENLIAPGQYPSYVIFLEMDPDRIDVNVHPTKQEIKFENERVIYNYLKVTIRHALGRFGVIPSLDFEQDPGIAELARPGKRQTPDLSPFRKSPGDWEKLFEGVDQINPIDEKKETLTIEASWDRQDELVETLQEARPFQIKHKYILSPIKTGFVIIDQTAARSRIFYEQFYKHTKIRAGSQQLLFPETIHLEYGQAVLLGQLLPEIQSMGFSLEPFGSDSFIMHAIPDTLADMESTTGLIQDTLERFSTNKGEDTEPLALVARSLAEEAATRKPKQLTVAEMNRLIDELFACEQPFRTPGGKLCFIQYNFDQIEKLFNA